MQPFEKGSDDDLLREIMVYVANRMMDLEVENVTGAAHGERSPARINHRNGYRKLAVALPIELGLRIGLASTRVIRLIMGRT
jgi:hypothetical protein